MHLILLSALCSVLVSVLLKLAPRARLDVGQLVTWNYLAAGALCAWLLRPPLDSLTHPDTPWAALSGEDGIAAFDAVPDGPVRIRVWQADQLIDLPPQQVTLTAAPASATMQLQVVPRRRRV